MTRYNGYRSGTIRHDDWEYRRAGWYFVTICTGDRRPFLGRVRNGIVGLSAAGCIAAREWHGRPEFEWQSRFYDRIIRDAEAFRAVRRYIRAHLDKSAVRNEEDGFDLHS